MTSPSRYRLPTTVVPIQYRVTVIPNVSAARFEGTVEVAVEVVEPTSVFVLNAADLTVSNVTLSGAGDLSLSARVSYRAEEEQVHCEWPEPVKPGRFTLQAQFSGVLNDQLRGFYRSTYTEADGLTGVLCSTQCEPTDARRIFPCWDEPAFKAVFQMTLVVDEGVTALSNGPETHRESLGNGTMRVVFKETPPMSSYLVAIVVGPFTLTPTRSADGVPVRIGALPGRAQLTGLAEEAAVHAVQFFQEYFGIPYPGDKLDHVAIPDFAFGAMENLGLVTYRETALLVDRNQASTGEQRSVVSVIAHETAHMWFGDLVTMRWWDGVWLNEAFATFMALLATDAYQPRWDVWTTFGLARASALSTDALSTTRPIQAPVGSPADALAMLDILTYSKGAAVLRMMEQYLSPAVFRQGISRYLNTHRYGNTETTDLWDALESCAQEPVRAVMDSWVLQGGHPVVTAALVDAGRTLHLEQRPFLYQGSGDGRTWQVPVTVDAHYVDGTTETLRGILGPEPLRLTLAQEPAWLLVNPKASGFYRVAYEDALADRLYQHWGDLSQTDRLARVVDTWASALAGSLSLSHVVKLWRTLGHETSPDIWARVGQSLNLLNRMVEDAERSRFESLVRDLVRPGLDALGLLGVAGEEEHQARLRAQLYRLMGTLGADSTIQADAARRFRDHVSGRPVEPELLPAVVDVVAAAGGAAEWEVFHQQAKTATTPQDEVRYLEALGGFKDPGLLARTLELYLSPAVRTQDAPGLIAGLLGNRFASRMTWDAIESHWDHMKAVYPVSSVGHLMANVSDILDEELAHRIEAWLHTHPLPQAARFLAQRQEMGAVHRAFAARERSHLAEVLS